MLSDLLQSRVAPGYWFARDFRSEADELETALLVLGANGGPSWEAAQGLPVWRILGLLKKIVEIRGKPPAVA